MARAEQKAKQAALKNRRLTAEYWKGEQTKTSRTGRGKKGHVLADGIHQGLPLDSDDEEDLYRPAPWRPVRAYNAVRLERSCSSSSSSRKGLWWQKTA